MEEEEPLMNTKRKVTIATAEAMNVW